MQTVKDHHLGKLEAKHEGQERGMGGTPDAALLRGTRALCTDISKIGDFSSSLVPLGFKA